MKRILVVDDDAAVARSIGTALKTTDIEHSVDYCSDGAQGKARAAQGQYDLITMDIHMPLMGGVEALREIKANPKSAHIPVIVVTGQHEEVFHRRVLTLGAAAVITKPFDVKELGSLLGEVLSGELVEAHDSPQDPEEDPGIRPLDA
jgi:CheY-like chemotaxis protein